MTTPGPLISPEIDEPAIEIRPTPVLRQPSRSRRPFPPAPQKGLPIVMRGIVSGEALMLTARVSRNPAGLVAKMEVMLPMISAGRGSLSRKEGAIGLCLLHGACKGRTAQQSVQIRRRIAVRGRERHHQIGIEQGGSGGAVRHAERLAHGPGPCRQVAVHYFERGLQLRLCLLDAVGIALPGR